MLNFLRKKTKFYSFACKNVSNILHFFSSEQTFYFSHAQLWFFMKHEELKKRIIFKSFCYHSLELGTLRSKILINKEEFLFWKRHRNWPVLLWVCHLISRFDSWLLYLFQKWNFFSNILTHFQFVSHFKWK